MENVVTLVRWMTVFLKLLVYAVGKSIFFKCLVEVNTNEINDDPKY